ncbi:hypothetical protein NEOLEDRAFT_1183124 [Neolentinus lepideus HHB14362 ss-1]|uniref:Uncharacterized protein n=1 Tax=Neolentinus lepideus HHB14362 ss-1 TaxID=1314782 RepID=A0A165NJM4_9AGAM|nr:hypothetical protein NEOLEDRAFT_1183124 [Neolentinus lepideus HHB14362 ss-1]
MERLGGMVTQAPQMRVVQRGRSKPIIASPFANVSSGLINATEALLLLHGSDVEGKISALLWAAEPFLEKARLREVKMGTPGRTSKWDTLGGRQNGDGYLASRQNETTDAVCRFAALPIMYRFFFVQLSFTCIL